MLKMRGMRSETSIMLIMIIGSNRAGQLGNIKEATVKGRYQAVNL